MKFYATLLTTPKVGATPVWGTPPKRSTRVLVEKLPENQYRVMDPKTRWVALFPVHLAMIHLKAARHYGNILRLSERDEQVYAEVLDYIQFQLSR